MIVVFADVGDSKSNITRCDLHMSALGHNLPDEASPGETGSAS